MKTLTSFLLIFMLICQSMGMCYGDTAGTLRAYIASSTLSGQSRLRGTAIQVGSNERVQTCDEIKRVVRAIKARLYNTNPENQELRIVPNEFSESERSAVQNYLTADEIDTMMDSIPEFPPELITSITVLGSPTMPHWQESIDGDEKHIDMPAIELLLKALQQLKTSSLPKIRTMLSQSTEIYTQEIYTNTLESIDIIEKAFKVLEKIHRIELGDKLITALAHLFPNQAERERAIHLISGITQQNELSGRVIEERVLTPLNGAENIEEFELFFGWAQKMYDTCQDVYPFDSEGDWNYIELCRLTTDNFQTFKQAVDHICSVFISQDEDDSNYAGLNYPAVSDLVQEKIP